MSTNYNKAVIDRRLRPRCCHLGSYFKRPKSSSVRPLACNWYYCAQFIAKPKAACALHFGWTATSSNLGLWANMTSSIKPELRNVSLRRRRRTEPRSEVACKRNFDEDQTCSFEDMIADRHTDRHAHQNTLGEVTSQSRRSRLDRLFVGIKRHNALI